MYETGCHSLTVSIVTTVPASSVWTASSSIPVGTRMTLVSVMETVPIVSGDPEVNMDSPDALIITWLYPVSASFSNESDRRMSPSHVFGSISGAA